MVEVSGLPTDREHWSEDMETCTAKAQFVLHGDPPLEEKKKQGTLRLSLPPQFIQPTEFIIRYFMYEGRYSYLHGIHFKLLCSLRHANHPVNLPSFLFNIVKRQATFVQVGKDQSVSHHCLI